MVNEHSEEADCSICNAFFKKEEDVLRHSNICSGVIPPNTCDKCKRDVISRAALKKHMPGCQGKKQREDCKNGELCRYHKANRCLFFHPSKRNHQPASRQNNRPNMQSSMSPNQDQEWHTIQRRNRKALWTCNFCDENIYNQEASRRHGSTCKVRHSQSQNVLPQRRQSLWCQFQDRCNKGLSCTFKHLEGFPKRNQPQNQH